VGIIGRIGKVIDHNIDKLVEVIVETRAQHNQKAYIYCSSGEDSVPVKNDKVLLIHVDGTGKNVMLGFLVPSQGAKPGEKIYFGRDQNGNIVSKLSMLNDGLISIKADGNIEQTTKTDFSVNADNNADIEAKNKTTVKAKDVEMNGDVVATGGSFTCKGTASPTGTGCLCAQPFCLFTGAPHIGERANGT
jgi:selenophosphate synthetase-related protein